MNDDKYSGYTPNVHGSTPPTPAEPAWQLPQPPAEPASPNPQAPAVDYARNQLEQAYQTQTEAQTPNYPHPPAYNPYHQPESAFHMPENQPAAPTMPPAPNPVPPAQGGYVTSTNQYQANYDPNQQQQVVHGTVDEQPRSVAEIKQQLLNNVRQGSKPTAPSRWKPILTALIVGMSFMFISYNEVAIAQIRQYISPGSALTTPVIIDPTSGVAISDEPRIIIPKINVDVPVVYDEKSYDEGRIQAALERGVVHYGQTAVPGQIGNNVIVGHSSNNFFNSGKYKFAFVLLDRLENGDTFILHYKGERYIYKVFHKEIITPDDFSLIQPTDKPVTTLITCSPPGTSWRRLVVQAEQISPSTDSAKQSQTDLPTDFDTPVPGNAPSFWDRIF